MPRTKQEERKVSKKPSRVSIGKLSFYENVAELLQLKAKQRQSGDAWEYEVEADYTSAIISRYQTVLSENISEIAHITVAQWVAVIFIFGAMPTIFIQQSPYFRKPLNAKKDGLVMLCALGFELIKQDKTTTLIYQKLKEKFEIDEKNTLKMIRKLNALQRILLIETIEMVKDHRNQLYDMDENDIGNMILNAEIKPVYDEVEEELYQQMLEVSSHLIPPDEEI